MRAIQINAPGGADVLLLHDVSEPVAGPGQAVVRVEAAGVNFIDVYVREGRYPAQLPLVPGQEAAGTVVAVGDGVTTVKSGDRVAWCGVLGTYAEYASLPLTGWLQYPTGSAVNKLRRRCCRG